MGLFEAARLLNPEVDVNDIPLIVSTAELFAIDRRRLGPGVTHLSNERAAILRALDLLFTGF